MTEIDPPHHQSAHAPAGRFPSTGDAQVDEALAGLPDPDAVPNTDDAGNDGASVGTAGNDTTSDGDRADTVRGPDPATHVDGQIADVTEVHRRLQQRLSDLSG